MAALSFALVEDVRLLQAYIRGRFVLLQRQSFIEEPLVLWMRVRHLHCESEFSGGASSDCHLFYSCDYHDYTRERHGLIVRS